MSTIILLFHLTATCLIMLTVCTNLLLFPLAPKVKMLMFLYLAIMYMLATQIGQASTIVCIFGIQIIVFLGSSEKLINCCFSLAGYLFSVCFNHFLMLTFGLTGIAISELNHRYALSWAIFYLIIIYIITFFIGRFLRERYADKLKNLPSLLKVMLFAEMILCTFIYILNIMYGEELGYKQRVLFFNICLFLLFLMMASLIFCYSIQVIRREAAATLRLRQLESLQEYTEKVESLYQNIRSFKHDYLNILSTLSSFIEEENLPALKSYFKDHILVTAETLKHKDSVFASLSNMKILEVKGLLYTKLLQAMNLELNIHLELRDSIDTLAISPLDLSKVLGIFLDNAIEEAQNTPKRLVGAAFIVTERCVTITIENSCHELDIPIEKLYQNGFSTKPKRDHQSRGLGLSTAKSILENYPNLIHTTTCADHTFTQLLEIYSTTL